MDVRTYDEHAVGLTWVAEHYLSMASHALVLDGRVWIVDPIEAGDAIDRAAGLGEPAGVLKLYWDHNRDGAAVAERLGVPFHDLPTAPPAGAPFELVSLDLGPKWKERALWIPEHKALVVSESIGTGHLYRLGSAPAGVHGLRRLFPPRGLGEYEPEHLLVGHGAPLHGADASAGLHEALRRSRADLPRMMLRPQDFVRGALARR